MMKLKFLKGRFFYLAVIVALGILVLKIPHIPQKNQGKVKSIVDGDTIELRDGRIIHYIGVDSPRINVQQEDKWVFFPEPFAVEAREFNEQLVAGKTVRLEFDVQEKDRFGRFLAYCYLSGNKKNDKEIFVNENIIEEGLGYAVVGQVNSGHVDEFFKAEKTARENKKNIWQNQEQISPRFANRYIDQRKIIEGKVVDAIVTKRAVTLLFHRRRKSYARVVILNSSLVNFDRNNIDAAAFYIGKTIRVAGLIRGYPAPEIVIMHPYQVEVVE